MVRKSSKSVVDVVVYYSILTKSVRGITGVHRMEDSEAYAESDEKRRENLLSDHNCERRERKGEKKRRCDAGDVK